MAPAYRGPAAHLVIALWTLLVWTSVAAAQSSGALPLAPVIRSGTLPNGLTYFIRPNQLPRNRAMLRLVVRAGSVDEADDQRGLAHMLEHMAFNGTTHFPPGQLVAYLESIGARFGPHVNAQTSFDETIYMLDVPTDRQGVLQRGIEALGDFAGGISLDPKEVDEERGVVLEEWRGNLGAGTRMQEPQFKALFGASKYTNRLPIGTPESIKSFPLKRLRDFYEANYRPARMAVIIVGDIKVPEVEKLIESSFGSIPRGPGRNRPVVPIPTHQDTRVVSLADPEQTSSSVTIMIKRPFEALENAETYRRSVVKSLVYQMFNDRLGEISRRSDAPFLVAQSGADHLGRTVEAATVSARVQDGRIPQGLSGIATEVQRLRQFGFGAGELERAKLEMKSGYERAYNERDKTPTGGLTDELVRHYLYKEAAPGIERELALVNQILPKITVAEVGALAKEMFAESNRVVLAAAPSKDGLTAVSETALRDALRAGTSATLTAWHDESVTRDLMAKKPQPGSVTARREIPEIGVTVLTLSNGVEVWLKPTDFSNDQIAFTGYAPGGTTLASQDDYYNASYASALVGLAGIGGLTPVDLSKLLAGKTAGVSTAIGTFTQTVSGAASVRDVETMLQLAYLRLTAPNRDPGSFDLMRRQLETSMANQEASPTFAYSERLNAINTMNHYTARELTEDDIRKLNPDRMMDFYRQRFANAADFTYFFVGAFKVDQIAPLIAAYIGALPSTGKATSKRGTLGMTFPASVVTETVKRGQEPRSLTTVTYFANTGGEELEDHRLGAAVKILQGRLRDILREQMGGTYSVSAGYSSTSPEPGYGVVQVQFGSSPENVEKLTKAVLTEVDKLRRDGPSASDVTAVKEAEKNDIQTSLRDNGYWLRSLQAMHQLGRDPRKINQRMERAESLTVDNVHAAFTKYFPADRYTIVMLMPATTPASAATTVGR
jgi:zinc protease